MFATNHKITSRQLKKMLVFDIISITMLIVPGIAAQGAGRDGIISIIAGSAGACLYGLMILYFTGKIEGEYLDFTQKTVGRVITFLFGILYLIKLTFACLFTISLFTKVINDTLLPGTNLKLILGALILTAIYSSAKGIEVRGRVTEILFYIVIIPLLVLFAFGLTKVDIYNLFPLFTESPKAIAETGYSVLLTYSAVELLLFAVPVLTPEEKKERRPRLVIQAVVIAAVINVLLFILLLGLLGPAMAADNLNSSVTIMQIIEMPGGFVQRQDAIIFTIWLFSIFTIISTYFYYLAKISNKLIRLKKKNYYLVIFGLLIFFMVTYPIPSETLLAFFGKYMAYIGLPQSLIIPGIILIVAAVKKKWRATNEK